MIWDVATYNDSPEMGLTTSKIVSQDDGYAATGEQLEVVKVGIFIILFIYHLGMAPSQ